ncbi:MAG TPA: hypothetical protein VFE37_24335 [Chloroflexota bacterium]|nr:hypothetical protein [Chloroflexota bacterium]
MVPHRAFSRRVIQHALVIGAVAAAVALAASGTALAQSPPTSDSGPRFGQWGPGQAAPAPEGPSGGDAAPRNAPSTGPGAQGDARPGPFGAPAPDFAPGMPPAPYPSPDRWGGCNYDLRGTWQIIGRQTDPYDFNYQAQIYVRQYRNWLQIDQPSDDLSYYGICRGDQIELDVYASGRFVGYEDGVVSWGSSGRSPWNSPWTPRNSGRVRATWTSFAAGFATGHETWHRW